ncbi:hypothetical protein [Lactiplantibacillus fabifermentans]|uniref:Uncharacterized protein n=2 Tax=Lactiplantibacillus fabifermentans TaxID=483011 RepID=A0A0R2NS76_9LACO|nr:hypothetical protein [Lactiplantibacillus fabifermentans]ETY74758.1 hypothetical protein LFAB_05790 [Lactiplantibacillus fabifermentans T30PCM01]KRO28561.1 hypothetical protein DY78_GL002284 [Lactiplantibacillus fabifermentans DSM 21115]
MGDTFRRAQQLLGSHYVLLTTERYGDVAEYVDQPHHYRLVLALSAQQKVSAIILYHQAQYAYQF